MSVGMQVSLSFAEPLQKQWLKFHPLLMHMSFQLVVHNLCLYLKKPHYYCDKNAKKTHDVFVQWQQVNAQHFSRDHIHSFLHSSRYLSLSPLFSHVHTSLCQPMLHIWLILQSLGLSWFSDCDNIGQSTERLLTIAGHFLEKC